MDFTAFILFLFVLQGLCLYIGKRSSKETKTQDDYFLAGKNVRLFPLMMTFLATQVGGGTVLGAAEEAYHFGWSVLLYPLGGTLGLILLGLGLGRKLAAFQVSTIAQIFEVAYGSSVLKKMASALSIISLFLIFVAQLIASSKFMVSLGVDNPLWFLFFWGMVIVYTAIGGFRAVVATDVVQASFFICAFVICFFYIAWTGNSLSMNLTAVQGLDEGFSFDSLKIFGWLFMPFLFMIIEQGTGQRCFAAESPRVVSRATLWAGVISFVVCIFPVCVGIFARQINIAIPQGASVFMTAIQYTTNPVLSALVGSAVIAAIISTADSLINAISSNLSQDFTLLNKNNVRMAQILTVGIALVGICFSFCFNNVVEVVILSYELYVCCLFVPIFIALLKRKGHLLSASLAIFFGASGFVFFRIVQVELPRELLALLLSFLGYFIGDMWMWLRSKEAKTLDTLQVTE